MNKCSLLIIMSLCEINLTGLHAGNKTHPGAESIRVRSESDIPSNLGDNDLDKPVDQAQAGDVDCI